MKFIQIVACSGSPALVGLTDDGRVFVRRSPDPTYGWEEIPAPCAAETDGNRGVVEVDSDTPGFIPPTDGPAVKVDEDPEEP